MKKNCIILLFCLSTTSITPQINAPRETINYIFELLQNAEHNNYIGEEILQLNHALQAANEASLLSHITKNSL